MILPLPAIIGRPRDLRDHTAPDGAATAEESLASLDEEFPPTGSARHLLDMTALVDPRGIPADLFSADSVVAHLSVPLTHTITGAETRDLLLGLHQRSLLSVSLGGGDRVVWMPSDLQRGTRRLLTAERRATLALVLASALVQRWPSVVADLDLDLLRLLRCATALAENAGADLLRGGTFSHVLLRLVGQTLAQLGLPSAALDYTSALSSRVAAALGSDHPEALRARADAASWRGHAGDRHGAIAEYSAYVADCQRLLGPEHPETLDARANLASQRARANEVRQAVAELESVLAIQVRTLGETDRRTLVTRARTTTWRAQADLDTPDTAIDIFDDVLYELCEHHPGEVTELFRTRSSLATALTQSRRPAEGADVIRHVLADQLRLFRTETPATIATRRRLIRACDATGNQRALQRARRELADRERWVVARYERLFGASQPDVLAMRAAASVPAWGAKAGSKAASSEIAHLRQLRADLMRTRPNDQETLRAWSNLAVAIGRAGEPEEAVAELRELRDHAGRAIGDTNPEFFMILSRLASWEGKARYRSSAVLTLKTLVAGRAENHPLQLTALYSLADQYRRNGNAIGLADTLCQLLAVRERHDLPENPLTLKGRLRLVIWRAKHGEAATVVSDLRQVVKAHQDRLGRHHADTLAAEFQLAHWLWETGHPEDARVLLTALQFRQGKFLKPRSPQIVETAKTLDRWKATPPPPQAPLVPPVTEHANETAASQVDALLSRLAGREVVPVALLEVLAMVSGRELSAAAWQAVATKYCATAIVERTDLDALVAAADAIITTSTDVDGRTSHRIADPDVAQSVLHRAAQRTGLPPSVDTGLRRRQAGKLIASWERQDTPPSPL